MFTLTSLLMAMIIAGAFWVGILAARRLREWGDGRRQLTDGDAHTPLALAAATGNPNGGLLHDATSQRIRNRVAQRLRDRMAPSIARELPQAPGDPDLDLTSLRPGDVVSVSSGDAHVDGDYLVDGVVNLREGGTTHTVVAMADTERVRWLIGAGDPSNYFVVEPVSGHGLSGEPPRHIHHAGLDYALQRRGQASAAGLGMHGRPALPRVATYFYQAHSTGMLWVERWGDLVLMGAGIPVPMHEVEFLPGS